MRVFLCHYSFSIASSFLLGNEWDNILLTAIFCVCGAGFLFVGFMRPELEQMKEISRDDMAKTAFDNRALINKV